MCITSSLIIATSHYPGCELQKMETSHPKWTLDRKGSGFLFWRRADVCPKKVKQVKFRCDVEVVEFFPSEDPDEMEAPSALAAAICLVLIAATLSYQWFL